MHDNFVGRLRVQSHRNDRPPQIEGAAGERDFFRSAPFVRVVEFALLHHVKREDEVRLRLVLRIRLSLPSGGISAASAKLIPRRNRSALITASAGNEG